MGINASCVQTYGLRGVITVAIMMVVLFARRRRQLLSENDADHDTGLSADSSPSPVMAGLLQKCRSGATSGSNPRPAHSSHFEVHRPTGSGKLLSKHRCTGTAITGNVELVAFLYENQLVFTKE